MSVVTKTGLTLPVAVNHRGVDIIDARNIYGESLYDESGTPDYTRYQVSQLFTTGLWPCQAFDIYHGLLFQFKADSTQSRGFNTYNFPAGTLNTESIMGTFGHSNSVSFAKNEFYSPGDIYPLCYISALTYPCKIYINRITPGSSLLIKTLSFPASTGYNTCGAYDEINKIMYLVGYTQDDVFSDQGGNNRVIDTKWNMRSQTMNEDGSYTPQFISSYEIPFIYVMQGLTFHDGMIFITSGGTDSAQALYAIDPDTGSVLYTFTVTGTTEVEGIAFIDNFHFVLGLQMGEYRLYTLAELDN